MQGIHSVAIASPHAIARNGINSILSADGWRVQGTCQTTEELWQLLNSVTPEMVILDACLAGDSACVVRDLRQRGHIVVVVVGPERPGAMILDTLIAGAGGCVDVEQPVDEFIESLRLVMRGSLVVYSDAAQMLLDEALREDRLEQSAELTPRQSSIAALVARGASNKEIAATLGISERTVKVHLSTIMDKLNLQNRQQLAVHAVRCGLVQAGRYTSRVD